MSTPDDTREATESDQQSDVKQASDRPQVDVIEAMQDSVALANADDIKNPRFTVDGSGDSKFAIAGLTDGNDKDLGQKALETAERVKELLERTPTETSELPGRAPGNDPGEVTEVDFSNLDAYVLRAQPYQKGDDTVDAPAKPGEPTADISKEKLREERLQKEHALRDMEEERRQLEHSWWKIDDRKHEIDRDLDRYGLWRPDKVEKLEQEKQQLKLEQGHIERRIDALGHERQRLEKEREQLLQQELIQSRESLKERAAEKIKNRDEQKKFLENMDKFEKRAAESKPPLSDEQILQTYDNINRLLEKNEKAPVKESDRVIIAQQAMEHAADTSTISQGSHGTCNVATIETRTFARDPAEATRLLSDVATTGKYESNGKPPVIVELDKQSLQKQGESNEVPSNARVDGHREYASQIFQVTALNVALEKKNQSTTPAGRLKYEQHPPIPGRHPPPDDFGERLMDYSKTPAAEVRGKDGSHGTGVPTRDIADAAREISPKTSQNEIAIDNSNVRPAQLDKLDRKVLDLSFLVENINDGKPIDHSDPRWAKKAHESIDEKEGLSPEKREELHKLVDEVDKDEKCGVVYVSNEQEMKDTLARLKREEKLPVIVYVETNNEPFWTDSGGGDAGGSGGAHVVTITDYDEKTGMAKMQNQWNSASSHDISAGQLFNATRQPKDRIDDLKKEVDEARKSNKPDYVKEYELLRLQHKHGQISDDDYEKKIVEITVERYREATKPGAPKVDDQYRKATNEVHLMINKLENSEKKEDRERGKRIKEAVLKEMKAIDERNKSASK